MRHGQQHVVVMKQIYSTNRPDYLPVTFEIEVEEHSVTDISVESAKYIYKELGKLLSNAGDESSYSATPESNAESPA
jgi:hypothetical protein